MSSFKYPDLAERQSLAAAAKNAMLEKFRAATQDPAAGARRKARTALNDARVVRAAERDAEKKERQAEKARQAARAAEHVAQAQREAEQAEALLAADKAQHKAALEAGQKVVRDARYAARKSAKKERRRGY